jgi:YVTN family beta-propeller protein
LVLIAALSLMGACGGVSSVSNPIEPDFYIAHTQGTNPIWFKSGSTNPAPLTIPALGAGTSVNDLVALSFTGSLDWLYLVSVNANALVILNEVGSSFQLVATVPVGVSPFGLAIDDNASFGYVSNTGGNSVTVVDLTTNHAAGTIPLPAGSQPRGIAVTPDGGKVYVANSGTGTVSIIDTATRAVTGSITVGSQPNRMAMSSNGHELYVSNTGSNSVSVIDVLSDTVSTTITGASNTRAVAVGGAGTDLFIGQAPTISGLGSVALYDTATVASNTTPTATAANPAYLLGIGPGSFLSADQNAARVTELWVTIGNPVVNRVFTVGESPAALAIVREVNRAPSTPSQCKLTVTTAGSGTVAVNPASPDGNYACGTTTVTLTATPGAGSQFTQWSGDLTGSANPATLRMDTAKNVTATFTPIQTVTHTVTTDPVGFQVQIDTAAAQTAPVQVSWTPGSAHTLGAPLPQTNASGDTQYNGPPAWSPAGPTISSAPPTATTYTGTFDPTGYRLTVATSPANCAMATLNPAAPSGFYNPGQLVLVSATPAAGFAVTSITGVTNGAAGASVTMSQPQIVIINCQQQATVTAAYSKESSGGNIVLTYTNTGAVTATNVRINSVASNTDSIVLAQGAGGGVTFPVVLGNLAPGQSMSRSFSFSSNSPVASVNVAFTVTVVYQADNMAGQTAVIQVPFPR